jgi:superfamily II DNA or RNA helicase
MGWFYVPYEAIGGDAAIRAERRKLTYKSPYAAKGERPIRMFKELPQEGYLGMPRAYGMLRYPWLPIDDKRTDGEPMSEDAEHYVLPSPYHPSVREPEKQAQFMADIDRAFIEQQHFLAYATTGSGKTVCGSRSAVIHRRRTAVFVPLERLMDMWHDTLTKMFKVPEHRIGIVQSDRCEYEGKDFVLCMMKSLGGRRYHPDFYKSIGVVMPDEVHRIGTPELAMITAQFPARVRCGLTATPERGDGAENVLFWHIGPIKVRSEAEAVPIDIYVKKYDDGGRMAAVPRLKPRFPGDKPNDHGFRIKKLTEDETRNRVLAEMIFRLWRQGRKVLAIGEHVRHAQHVMELCVLLGIPRDRLGQATGERHVRQPDGSVRKVKTTKAEFKHAKENGDVVFATYGSFKEGIDEKRLDAIVPLTPQSKDKQVRGRVRRPFENKTNAIGVYLQDVGDWMSMNYWRSKEREWPTDATVRVIYGKL